MEENHDHDEPIIIVILAAAAAGALSALIIWTVLQLLLEALA
jgi:hypothetical protein